jgi:hypothetical protein
MSNAYVNNILFGISKFNVDDEYIRGMTPYMLTEEWLRKFEEQRPLAKNEIAEPIIVATIPDNLVLPKQEQQSYDIDPNNNKKTYPLSNPDNIFAAKRKNNRPNSLFWSIYEVEHPEEAFLGTRANAEVEHRLKVVAELKKTPKRLKETNSKLTIEQTQALLGSMLVAKEDKLDFCAAYSAYYNKPIIVVYPKTYRVFSPMIDVDLRDEDAIILYAEKPAQEKGKNMAYSSEKTPTSKIICDIMGQKTAGPLKAMSNYKNPELDAIAAKLGVPVIFTSDAGKEKRRKKEDIYNDIKVFIHNDQN